MQTAANTAHSPVPRPLEDLLVSHVAGCRFENLPQSTVNAAKCLMLDTLGAILAARDVPDIVRLSALIRGWGGDEATLIGSSDRVIAHHAALINGTMARALELDDVHEKAILHATATILPVALAAMELRGGVSGKELLTAVALGIDLSARISLALAVDVGSSAAPTRTMSFTYQTGILVGSLVAARIMGLDENAIRNVLGVAYSQCAGNQQALFEGVSTVRVQQGLSAMTAVLSAQLGKAGVTGARHSLEGAAGYFQAFHQGRCDRDVLLDGLGARFEVENVSIKPFPCCKYTHTAIAAALEVRAHPEFELDRVTSIVAHVDHREYYEIVCQPESRIERRRQLAGPDGRVRAQFSLPYVVAAALRDGEVGLRHFTEPCRCDPRLLALTDKVSTTIDAGAPARALPIPGVLDIYLRDRGAPIRASVAVAKGHPRNPMSYEEVTGKFLRVSSLHPGAHERTCLERVATEVASLDSALDARHLIHALAAMATHNEDNVT